MLHHALELGTNADSTECCMLFGMRHVLAVGTYELNEASQQRKGCLHLYSLCSQEAGQEGPGSAEPLNSRSPQLQLQSRQDMQGKLLDTWLKSEQSAILIARKPAFLPFPCSPCSLQASLISSGSLCSKQEPLPAPQLCWAQPLQMARCAHTKWPRCEQCLCYSHLSPKPTNPGRYGKWLQQKALNVGLPCLYLQYMYRKTAV